MKTEPQLPLASAARRMQTLRSGLVETLARSERPEVVGLAESVRALRDSDAVTLVLVGQHDAGKSSLLRCLTGRDDIDVGAGPTTTVSRRYAWDGHVLVDTPGVLAGVDATHDALSWGALAAADVVVFVVTVEGFDDLTLGYFEQVRGRLGNLRSLVLVVNKALSERSEPAVVAQDILEALGPGVESVPLVWTDAKRWQEADARPSPAAARTESGIQELADQLTAIARGSGAELRLLSVLRSWSEVCQEALRHLADEPGTGDEPLLRNLDDLLDVLVGQRDEGLAQVNQRAEEATAVLRSDLLRAGPDIDEDTLTGLVGRAFQHFHEDVARDGAGRDAALERWVPPERTTSAEVAVPGVDLQALVQRSLGQVARMFSGAGARPGGAGHTLVYNTWKALGGNFRSWGAVNASRTIGKVAGRANVGLTVGLAGWELLQARRAAQAARAHAQSVQDWAARSRELAEGIVRPWRDHAAETLETVHDVRWRELARQRLAVLTALADRDMEASELITLESAINELCESFSRTPPVE